MADATLGAYNIADLREMARRRLPRGMFEFVDRGTEDEVALATVRHSSASRSGRALWSMFRPAARKSRSSAAR